MMIWTIKRSGLKGMKLPADSKSSRCPFQSFRIRSVVLIEMPFFWSSVIPFTDDLTTSCPLLDSTKYLIVDKWLVLLPSLVAAELILTARCNVYSELKSENLIISLYIH